MLNFSNLNNLFSHTWSESYTNQKPPNVARPKKKTSWLKWVELQKESKILIPAVILFVRFFPSFLFFFSNVIGTEARELAGFLVDEG